MVWDTKSWLSGEMKSSGNHSNGMGSSEALDAVSRSSEDLEDLWEDFTLEFETKEIIGNLLEEIWALQAVGLISLFMLPLVT